MSDDGAFVFFQSGVALTPQATNGGVYEYHEGRVSLIAAEGELVGTSASGGDVFFVTTQRLVPRGHRYPGGLLRCACRGWLPGTLGAAAGCAGDACQGSPGAATGVWRPVERGARRRREPRAARIRGGGGCAEGVDEGTEARAGIEGVLPAAHAQASRVSSEGRETVWAYIQGCEERQEGQVMRRCISSCCLGGRCVSVALLLCWCCWVCVVLRVRWCRVRRGRCSRSRDRRTSCRAMKR